MKQGHFFEQLKYALGGNLLDQLFFRFLKVHTLFLIFNTLPGVFINTFIMKQSPDVNIVLYYNCINFVVSAFAMVLTAYFSRKVNANYLAMLGIGLYNVLYITLIVMDNRAADYYYVLGIISGLAAGSYWMSYNNMLTDYTDSENRDKSLAIVGVCGSSVNLIIPLISGFLISKIPGNWGYISVFSLALCIAALTCVNMAKMPRKKVVKEKSRFKEALHVIFTNKCWTFGMLGQMCRGIRDGAFMFILSILLYELVQDTILIGFNTFLTGAVSIVTYLTMIKIIRPANRIKWMLVGVTILTVSGFLFMLQVNVLTILLFNVINAVFAGVVINATDSVFFGLVQHMPETFKSRQEIFSLRECALALGRCIGVFFIIGINHYSGRSPFWQAFALMLLTMVQYITALVTRKTMKLMDIHLQTAMVQEEK